jgi:hypothetical protein
MQPIFLENFVILWTERGCKFLMYVMHAAHIVAAAKIINTFFIVL